jgi:hypothetical protein
VAGLGTATAACLLAATGASASFHEMKIREVSSGTGSPDSSSVEVQMYAPGQTFLSFGAKLVRCDSTCSSPTTFQGFTNVAAGANQSTVLFGDSGVPSRDFSTDLNLNAIEAGGAVCYLSEPGFSDCMSWGNFSADTTLMANYGTSSGTPAPALSSGMALRRSIAAGCPTLLESGDDTDNSAADFSLATPNPRNNASPPTEMPCGAAKAKKKCKKKHKKSGSTPYSAKKHKCKKKHHRAVA